MKQAAGELVELYLENGLTGGRLLCPQSMIPKAGQYLLAHASASDALLPVPVFNGGSTVNGFLIAPPLPPSWQPGTSLILRGPLGHGFSMPDSARRVALIALGKTSARLYTLLTGALQQDASVVLVSDLDLPALPSEVEMQPLSALAEVASWADYLAIDAPRASLTGLREKFGLNGQTKLKCETQVLVMTPMPCGGMGECGLCAIPTRREWKIACKAGPVFDLHVLI